MDWGRGREIEGEEAGKNGARGRGREIEGEQAAV